MPIYEYECHECHRRFEVEQRFTDAALTTCETCGGSLRKVYSAVGVVFKGSGFYKTDNRPSSRSGGSSAAPASSDKSSASSAESSASGSSTASAAPSSSAASD